MVAVTFEVSPPALVTAGNRVRWIGSTVPTARHYVESYVVLGTGKHNFSVIKDKIERSRAELEASYADSASFHQYLQQGGKALTAIGFDYAGIDEATRARIDATLPSGGGTPTAHPSHGDPEVHVGDILATLQAPETGFEEYEQWRAIQGSASYILSMHWVFDLLAKVGHVAGMNWDLGQRVEDTFAGDWESVGRAAQALRVLEKYCSTVESETSDVIAGLDETWSGNAADAAFGSFDTFITDLSTHELALSRASSVLMNAAWGFRFLFESAADAIGMVVDFLGLWQPEDLLLLLVTEEAKVVLAELIFWVDVVILCIDLLFAFVGLFAMSFGLVGIGKSVSIPDGSMSRFQPPDVDGPR